MDYATWANVILVFVLVIITAFYAIDAHKARKAAEGSARAALAQAEAAKRSLDLLTKQIEEQAGMGRTIVKSTIQSALTNIEYWRALNLANLAARYALPATIEIVPIDAAPAVRHARSISIEGSEQLASAFDSMRLAQNECMMLRDTKQNSPQIIQRIAESAQRYLGSASLSLAEAQRLLQLQEQSASQS